ncbi:MAG: hypothetical protein WB421_08500 [Terriglobales bacterium]|jgi:hypothetical protein
MKVGAEDRNKLIIAIVLMVLAAASVGYWVMVLNGTPSSSAAASTPAAATVVPAPRAVARPKSGGKKAAPERSLDPSLRYDWLRISEDTKYSGTGRNIFRAEAEIPVALARPNTDKPKVVEATGPPPPPPPPPINVIFFGFASKPGELKKVFLKKDDDVFIAHEGDIVDRRYKVMRISAMAVEIEDVQTNNRQSIQLTQNQ